VGYKRLLHDGTKCERRINVDPSSRDKFRYFLKDSVRQIVDFRNTDQHRGIAPPPLEKPIPDGAHLIDLVPAENLYDISVMNVFTAIASRKSRRAFSSEPLTLKELSFLLWATQGVRKVAGAGSAFRVVPSAGCRHALETYLCIFNVEGIEEGIYRYLPIAHRLLLVSQPAHLSARISEATLGQDFVGKSAVAFIWTAVPYRMEWRYDMAAHKVIALDAGHVCQNLYTSCEAIRAATCAVAAYHQELMDNLLGVDGDEEFTIYLAPVGKSRAD
jgi:SagB-type dehydrogenase family enzyme